MTPTTCRSLGFSGTVGFLVLLCSLTLTAESQLSTTFYTRTCPNLFGIVRQQVLQAVRKEPRMAASLLRLHFHDCFVNGCDGSLLLDGSDGEKPVLPNANSTRGYEVVDAVKVEVERQCPGTVSCADILTIVARDSVVLAGGPSWGVLLGRRDSLVANQSGVSSSLPGPTETVAAIIAKFAAVGLNITDVVALSGGHTIGLASCATFHNRIANSTGTATADDPTLDADFAEELRAKCPRAGDANVMTPMDDGSSTKFDNHYFDNLLEDRGLLTSDQGLYSSNETAANATRELVEAYSEDEDLFFADFANSMIKMGNIAILTGNRGEIRKNCRVVNGR